MILKRLKQFIDTKGISIAAFEQSVGMSNASFGKSLKNNGAIGTDKLEKILNVYPEISPIWLLTGTGDMIKPEIDEFPIVCKNSVTRDLSETRPRIPIDAAAGSLSFALSAVSESQCERFPIIPQFPKYDFTIIARGDSMAPELESGDELACLFVQESSFIQWGRVHILDTEQGVVVKRVFDKGNFILCKSTNPDYEPFKIPKSEVYQMALVVGVIRRY